MKTKTIVKKVLIVLLISVLVELGLVFYNFIISKVYTKMHLIGNQSINIEKQNTTITNKDGNVDVKVSNIEDTIYNICLKLKDANGDVYMRAIMNNDATLMPKENVKGTKFKVYFLSGINSIDKTFSINFPESQLDIDNIESVIINENLDYMPKVSFSVLQFMVIFVIILAIYGLISLFKFLRQKDIKIKKEYIFLSLAVSIGIIYVFINVPQVRYDEHAHFWRAYEISKGSIISKTANELPKSMISLFSKEDGDYPNRQMNYQDIAKHIGEKLDKDISTPFAVGATGSLTPISYMPQLIGTIIGKLFNSSPIIILWLGRLTNLIAYIILVYFAIKLMPSEKFKSIIMIIALFPMSLNLAATYSPDTVILGFTLLAISYAMYLKFVKPKINIKNIALFAVLCMVPTVCKIVYFPLLLLFFTLPKEKFEGKTKKTMLFAIVLAIVFIPYLALNMIMSKGDVAVAIRTNSLEQIIFTVSDLVRDFGTAVNTLYTQSSAYLFEMIGGWNTMEFISIIILGILLIATFTKSKENEECKLTLKDKVIFSVIILIETLGIFAAMYLGWTQGRQEIVEGVQGRYFLPVIPLIMILISKPKLEINIKNKDIKYIVLMSIIYLSIIIYTINIFAHEIINII